MIKLQKKLTFTFDAHGRHKLTISCDIPVDFHDNFTKNTSIVFIWAFEIIFYSYIDKIHV